MAEVWAHINTVEYGSMLWTGILLWDQGVTHKNSRGREALWETNWTGPI